MISGKPLTSQSHKRTIRPNDGDRHTAGQGVGTQPPESPMPRYHPRALARPLILFLTHKRLIGALTCAYLLGYRSASLRRSGEGRGQ